MRYAPNRIAIHYAELVLKGRNRPKFEARLQHQVQTRLQRLELTCPVHRAGGRMLIDITDDSARLPEVLEMLGETPGIAIYFPAQHFPIEVAGSDETMLQSGPVSAALLDLARSVHSRGARFAVRVEHHATALRLSGRALERFWGTLILEQTPWEGVNLSAPDRTFHIAIYDDGVLLHADRVAGIGGLPADTSGRVLALLSGGIDSPVATFFMARRGCHVECLHFTANYLDRDQAIDTPLGRLARRLSRFCGTLTLHLVPYVPFDLALTGERTGYEVMLFRRFMLRTAERLARQRRAAALVTGDNLSQVASQTLDNLVALDAAVTIPVFRPLIGLNKQEIIAWARRIGTYETSIEPYKDCCALIGRNPKTRSHRARLEAMEAERLADYPTLIDTVLAEAKTARFELGELV